MDTLFIGQFKFPLKKVKTHFKEDENFPVSMPVKYADMERRRKFSFQKLDSLTYQSVLGEGGEVYTLIRYTTDSLYGKSIHVSSFLDTLMFDAEKISAIQPFIKSGKSKIYLCAATVYAIKNGLLTKYNVANVLDGKLFSEWETYPQYDIQAQRIRSVKETTLVVTNLFYRIGNATYFLDRQFVIRAK
jgi:hypothetical protein